MTRSGLRPRGGTVATRRGPDPTPGEPRWRSEQVCFDGARWFDLLIAAIDDARASVDFEMYIFADDRIGRRVAAALVRAARRGVGVRVLVDGAGSPGWRRRFARAFDRAGIEYQVHNELPWDRMLSPRPRGAGRRTLADAVARVNKRDHRKIVIVDGRAAYTGSRNVTDVHCSPPDEPEWRDTSIALEGDGVSDLAAAFEVLWQFNRRRFHLDRIRRLRRRGSRGSTLVRLNTSRAQRREHLRLIVHGLHRARRRIWLTAAYFVPRRSVLTALESAARRGVDVRVIVPRESDVPFMPWITATYYPRLHRAGVRMYEYLPANLHAKSAIVDDRFTVGTANLNHRSAIHDLEVDVVVTLPESRRALEDRFRIDLGESDAVTVRTAEKPIPVRAAGHLLLFFRHFL